MKLNECAPISPKEKARRLGLTSTRFQEKQMGDNAKQAIQSVKKRDRSDTKLDEWRKSNFYSTDATKQLSTCPENITRVHCRNLSVEQFVQRFEKPNLPVVIQGCTQLWNVDQFWSFEYMYQQFKDVKFKIGEDDDGYKLRVPLKYYFEYLIYNQDDSPLYMFESSLENYEEMAPILQHFQVPAYFKDDLLQYAGEKRRPPYRWLLMGPERSGSTVHIDPLATSAWNTSLQGYKRWVLFPENIPKFIVKGKAFRGRHYEDESINYFTEILPKIIESEGRERLGIIEFIQKPGQTIFVPGGWWHAVLNLTDTMAVTQNIMTHINFDKVWTSIRSERRKFAHKFLENMKQKEVSLYERAVELNRQDKYEMGNKYQAQSVSLSFTRTESSSSSSSSSDSDTEDNQSKSKRSQSQGKKRDFSRSREKKNRKNDKKRTQSLNGRKKQ